MELNYKSIVLTPIGEVLGSVPVKLPAFVFLGLCLPWVALAQPPAGLVSQGDDKRVHGDFRGAVADYTAALAEDSRDVGAYLGRASARGLAGDYAGAIADDTKAIALDPKNAVAFTNRGNARTSKGDLAGAASDYTRALHLNPHDVRALLNRGNIKNLQKRYRDAIADYSAAIGLEPGNAAAFYDRAGAERALADNNRATADYSQAIVLNPADVQAYLNRAVLRMAQGQWDGATGDLNKCLGLIPEERQAYPRIYLWVIESKRGEMARATTELSPYLQPGSTALAGTWGWQIANFLAGQTDEPRFLALARSFQVKKDRGQVAQAYYYAGLKRELAGNKIEAATFFRRCRETGTPSLHEFILARAETKPTGASSP